MTVVYIISFLLIAFGIVRILGLTPESIGADVSAILDRKKSLRDNAMRARGKKRTNKLVLWLDKIRRALSDTGKEKSFGVACAVALLLMILGCVGAIVIGNPFLAPVLAIALAMIPFLYLLRTVEQYEEQVKLELETGLSAITSSYERTMNLKSAVEENIDNLKPPVKGLFQSFLVEISVINPDVKAAICHLRERVKDCVWEEWCDTLISCQDDSQLIGTLYPVVEKLTDMRIVNAELKVMISENKREYYIMALMVVANIPLLYFLNKEWYGALMYTTFGKVTLAICGAVMLFTFLRMQKYTDEASVTLYAVWRYIPKTYEVKYDANGGGNTPARQTKTEDVTLILTSTIPTRYGYTFRGWATNPNATSADYQAGGSYTANESGTLYAVWKINTYTVSFDANGGTNAPNPQKKTHGHNLTLTVAIPTRANHVFLGWATDSTSKSVAYAPGATYTAEEDVTLYAVWQERNYDFSVSDLTVTPDEIEQYGKVTVKFRVDNWDRNLPYANVPVEVLLNGTVIYSTTVNFSAYGVQNIVFTLNVGASLGTQTLIARINWADHESETRTGNNSTSATYNVKKVVETSTSVVSVNGEYTEGSQVISSFYVSNEGSSDVLPEDNVSFDFLVYYLDGGKVKTVSQQTWDKVVIPANGRNLVYFKWTVPADSAGTIFYCKGTVSHANADKEQNSDNNTTEYAVVATDYVSSQTPNTRFEKNAPAGYSPNAMAPTAKAGSATWNMWEYENGRLVLKSYGITVGNTTPTVTPGSGCLTAEKVGATWKMKSGYGITLNWNPALVAKSGYVMPNADAYTEAQSVYTTFPEFGYSVASEKYRTLEKIGGAYGFVTNPNADKNERVHFIPVYVQDGSYTVSVTATQIWTPAGMITAIRNANTLTINGTIYDDYYVGN